MHAPILRKQRGFAGRPGPVVVCVMDGIGLAPPGEGNAVHLARKPNLDRLVASCPNLELLAHGRAVGMPSDDDMGNSEVGHNALGAGRVFDQGSKLVGKAIREGTIFDGPVFRNLVSRLIANHKSLHLIGLLSDGNVHSHIDHLFSIIRRADQEGLTRVYVHALLDGRDVPETSALQYVEPLEALLAQISERPSRDYRIASGGGRMKLTMDRYNADWGMVQRGWAAHVHGEGRRFSSLGAGILTYREEHPGLDDQNLPEIVVERNGAPVAPIVDGDAVVFFNFRGDRAIEISRTFEDEVFSHFDRGRRPDVYFAGMMQYDGDLGIPNKYLVTPPTIDQTLGEAIARTGLRQLAISETQKFGHVTYFWNGNRSGAFDESLENYVCIPSDTLPFEQRPWMKAAEIADRTIAELKSGGYHHARLNFANGDMVGHTGALSSTVLAVEAVDLCVGRLASAIRELGGILLVTADHGNADEMFELDKKGQISRDKSGGTRPKTSHTLNKVPFVIYDPLFQGEYRLADVKNPGLSSVAATVAWLMGYEPPEAFDPALVERVSR